MSRQEKGQKVGGVKELIKSIDNRSGGERPALLSAIYLTLKA